MNRKTFLAILKKYNEGKASAAESDFIERYYALFDALPDELAKDDQTALKKEILEKVMGQIAEEREINRRSFRTWSFAAVWLLLIAAAFTLWHYMTRLDHKTTINTAIVQGDIAPGGKRAQLILDGKKKIDLDEQHNGLLATQQEVQISKTAEGNLYFEANKQGAELGPARINQLITPPGGQYELTLADGTKVTLNAASRLSFPTRFSGHQRVVELEGEAYFEVAQQESTPFIVKAKDTEIMVLGTEFNVMAYADEALTKTTLIAGAVRVKHGDASKQIKAGMQAITSKNKPIQSMSVDVKEAVAWKEGYFYFQDEALEQIMRKLKRWYNIDVVYHAQANSAQTFGGMISSQNYISNILNIMELTDRVHFKIEGRRVTVMP